MTLLEAEQARLPGTLSLMAILVRTAGAWINARSCPLLNLVHRMGRGFSSVLFLCDFGQGIILINA